MISNYKKILDFINKNNLKKNQKKKLLMDSLKIRVLKQSEQRNHHTRNNQYLLLHNCIYLQ